MGIGNKETKSSASMHILGFAVRLTTTGLFNFFFLNLFIIRIFKTLIFLRQKVRVEFKYFGLKLFLLLLLYLTCLSGAHTNGMNLISNMQVIYSPKAGWISAVKFLCKLLLTTAKMFWPNCIKTPEVWVNFKHTLCTFNCVFIHLEGFRGSGGLSIGTKT